MMHPIPPIAKSRLRKVWSKELSPGDLIAVWIQKPVQRFNFYYIHKVDNTDPKTTKFQVLETTRSGVQFDCFEDDPDSFFVREGIKL